MILSKDLKSFPSFSDDKSIKSLCNYTQMRRYGMHKYQFLIRCANCKVLIVTPTKNGLTGFCQYCAREPIGD